MSMPYYKPGEVQSKMLHGKALMGMGDFRGLFRVCYLDRRQLQGRPAKTYVEIGTRWGGSAICAGLAGCEVWCIDPWDYPDKEPKFRTTPEMVRANWANQGLDPAKLHLLQQRHPPWPLEILHAKFDVGLIDGAHNPMAVEQDWLGMREHVTEYILFHDMSMSCVSDQVAIAAQDPDWELEECPYGSTYGILKCAAS